MNTRKRKPVDILEELNKMLWKGLAYTDWKWNDVLLDELKTELEEGTADNYAELDLEAQELIEGFIEVKQTIKILNALGGMSDSGRRDAVEKLDDMKNMIWNLRLDLYNRAKWIDGPDPPPTDVTPEQERAEKELAFKTEGLSLLPPEQVNHNLCPNCKALRTEEDGHCIYCGWPRT